jgi:PAS domain S-box-containing protein
MKLNIMQKQTLAFVLFAFVVLVAVGTLAYNSGRDALYVSTVSDLLSLRNEKEAALDAWVTDAQLDTATLAASPRLRDAVAALVSAAPNSPSPALSGVEGAQVAHDRVVAELLPWAGLGHNFLALSVLGAESGEVIAATDASEEGKLKEDCPYFFNGLYGPYVQNPYYAQEFQGPAMMASAPLRSADGRLLGVLVARLHLSEMNAIINRRTGQHQTDDAYLVNAASLFVTQPRLVADPAVLQRGVHTEYVKRCLAGESGTMLADDYRGVPMIAAYRWLPERQLCLVASIDQVEAFTPSRALGETFLLIGGLVLLLASALAFGLARSITRPILALQAGAARLGRGELDFRLPETSSDELGDLAREFNQMATAISEREAALGKWAHIFEHAQWGVAASGTDGKTLALMNPTFAAMHGYTVEELVGKPIVEVYAPQVRPEVTEYIRRAEEQGHYTFETKHLRKDGTVFPVLMDVTAVKDKQGKVLYRIGNCQDITERKQAEEDLRQRNRELSVLYTINRATGQSLDLASGLNSTLTIA